MPLSISNSAFDYWSSKHIPDDVCLSDDLSDRWEHVVPEFWHGEKQSQAKLLDGWIIDLRWVKISAKIENGLFSSDIIILREKATDGLFGPLKCKV